MIETLGQEPYIAYKLESLMKEQTINVCHYENIDVYLGKDKLVFIFSSI